MRTPLERSVHILWRIKILNIIMARYSMICFTKQETAERILMFESRRYILRGNSLLLYSNIRIHIRIVIIPGITISQQAPEPYPPSSIFKAIQGQICRKAVKQNMQKLHAQANTMNCKAVPKQRSANLERILRISMQRQQQKLR